MLSSEPERPANSEEAGTRSCQAAAMSRGEGVTRLAALSLVRSARSTLGRTLVLLSKSLF